MISEDTISASYPKHRKLTSGSTHVRIPRLWDCSRGAIQIDATERSHIFGCRQCIHAVALCRLSPSLRVVENQLQFADEYERQQA
jgi:hypothetical protein